MCDMLFNERGKESINVNKTLFSGPKTSIPVSRGKSIALYLCWISDHREQQLFGLHLA